MRDDAAGNEIRIFSATHANGVAGRRGHGLLWRFAGHRRPCRTRLALCGSGPAGSFIAGLLYSGKLEASAMNFFHVAALF